MVAGVALFVVTAEDTILTKLEWAQASESGRQLLDVVAILRARVGDLDDAYLDRWASDLGVASVMQESKFATGAVARRGSDRLAR